MVLRVWSARLRLLGCSIRRKNTSILRGQAEGWYTFGNVTACVTLKG
jgi:hypothetical protein